MKNLAFFVSGDGIFVKYILQHKHLLKSAHISTIICDQKNQAYEYFSTLNSITTFHADYSSGSEKTEEEIAKILELNNIDFIFLTYDQIIGKILLDKFKNKIFNLHLSILPLHPYLNALEKSIESKELFLGATFHEATKRIDKGRILGQFIMIKDTTKSYFELRLEVLIRAQVFFLDMIDKVTSRSRLSPKGKIHFLEEKTFQTTFTPPLSIEVRIGLKLDQDF